MQFVDMDVDMPVVVQRQVLVSTCRELRSPAVAVHRPVLGEAREDSKVQFMDTVVIMRTARGDSTGAVLG